MYYKMKNDEQKLKKLALKNKKLLESISAHLVNATDDQQQESHRLLSEKYRQLMGISRDNVSQNQKMQEQNFMKNQQLTQLKQQLIESKQQSFQQEQKTRKQFEYLLQRHQEDSLGHQQILQHLREQNQQLKRVQLKQQNKLKEEINNIKSNVEQLTMRRDSLAKQINLNTQKLTDKIKQYERIVSEQKNQILRLTRHNEGLENQIDKRAKKNVLEGVKELIGDYRKRKV